MDFSGSMPEGLMGTDCKFVGNMPTLVQIQLGPRIPFFDIHTSTSICFIFFSKKFRCCYNTKILKMGLNKILKILILMRHPLFPWDCSSIGQSTALSRRKLRVRAPSVPTDPINTLTHLSIFIPFYDKRGTTK